MAFENPLGTNNLAMFEASTGLRQYQAVMLSTGSLLINPTTLGRSIGVLVSSGTTNSTVSGRVQSVQVYGVAKMLAGSSAIVPGNYITPSTAAGAALVSGSTSNDVIGIALTAPGSTGVIGTTDDVAGIVSVLLLHLGHPSTVA